MVDDQNGVCKGQCCNDHLFSLKSIVETRKLLNRSTFVAYIDFSKAYDSINRQKLWYKLENLGINGNSKILKAIKSM